MDFDFDTFEAAMLDLVESSPVPDLLADSTLLPSNSQSRLISTHLSNLSACLSQINDIIRRSLSLQEKLQRTQSLHCGLNSRMRTLPSELLCEIFSLVHSEIEKSSTYTHRKMLAALPLSHVCRQWRSAALSCAKLWSSLGLQSPTAKRNRLKGELEWIKACITRSKGYPLVVSLDYAGPEESKFPPRTQAGLDLIVQERHRWRTVSLYVEDGVTLPPFMSMENAGPLPLLTSISVSGSTEPVEPPESAYTFFSQTEKLESVEIVLAPILSIIPPSWQTLQEFRTTNTISLLKALTSCPNLRVARREIDDPRIHVGPEHINAAFPDGQIIHPNLRKFRLLFGHCRNEVLALLSLPALEILALQDYERHDFDFLRILPTFLATSTHLRSLSLEIHLDVDDLPLFTNVLCNSLPSLEVLRLREDNPPLSLITVERPFCSISCLLASPETRPVPNLRTLEYHMAIDDWAEYDTAQGETAIFCMICLAALEKVTEEVVASRFKQADLDAAADCMAPMKEGRMKQLKNLNVYVDKIEGLERDVPFFHDLDKFVLERGLGLAVWMRVPGSAGDPLFDEDIRRSELE